METAFVVLSWFDDCGHTQSWISGVFATRRAAEAVISERMGVNKTYSLWHKASLELRPKYPFDYFKFPLIGNQKHEWDAMDAAGKRAAGPEPEYEPMEEAEIYEMPIGIWRTDLNASPVPE